MTRCFGLAAAWILFGTCLNSGAQDVPKSSTGDGEIRPNAGMMRFADVSADKIVFSYAGDLWIVDRQGGVATPLASPPGNESFPRFSPDGKTIAFVGDYDGNPDVYSIPVAGGIPKRMTYHPASESVCDWTSDGKIVFSTNGFAGLERQPQLFSVASGEPLPKKLPVPYGTNASISADGKWLAYTPHSHDHRTWKRYRGGMASDIWLYNLETNESKQITDWEGTDSLPMFHGDTVYYVADAGPEHRLNIWSYNVSSGQRNQVTFFHDYDCKWPSIGPGRDGKGEIIVQNGSGLWLVNLETRETQTIQVTIPGARPKLRAVQVDAADAIEGADVSPNAKRVVVEARGDIWTLPVKEGSPRNLTRTSGVAERSGAWSPDGRWIAYFSDATGEYELYLKQSDGLGETKQLTKDGKAFRFSPNWSPDSKRIVFTDKAGSIYLHTIGGDTKLVDAEPYAEPPSVNWSHDSAWLTYALSSENRNGSKIVFVYDIAKGSRHQVTSGFFNDSQPVFDREGDFLYLVSSQAFNKPQYEDLGTTFVYAGTQVILAVPLRKDVKLPLLPKNDEETWDDESKSSDDKDAEESDDEDKDGSNNEDADDEDQDEADDKDNGDDKDSDDAEDDESDDDNQDEASGEEDDDQDESEDDEDGEDDGDDEADNGGDDDDQGEDEGEGEEDDDDAKPVTIDFEGIERRSFQLPIKQGNFGGLAVNHENQLIYARQTAVVEDEPEDVGAGNSICLFDMHDDKKKPEEKTVVSGASSFAVTPDGKKLVVFRGASMFVVDAAPDQKLEDEIPKRGMIVQIDPRQEWKQVFTEAWRIQRDYFYDPNMHGTNWDAIYSQYAKMLDDCSSRSDVGILISEMISELNVGHAYYRPPHAPDAGDGPDSRVGLLGCLFEKAGNRYRIATIFEGAAWDADARNPLRAVGVKEGDYLLAVGGVELTADVDPYALFQGTVDVPTVLTISDDEHLGDKNRRVVVKPIQDDIGLRFRHWIEKNRKMVEEKTDGKVGYIYVINTGVPGQNDLFRQFYGQLSKEALIIDDRWNGGGQIPTRFIELLNRPVTNYWAKRDGRDWTWPPDSHQGPKCMLINGMAGSGGDMFPALFKQNKLGQLIGMRTWGGLVGITGNPGMIDGSGVTAPTFAYYETDGTWGIEGHGVDPDQKVVDDPGKMTGGGDPQLEAAISLMLAELQSHPYVKPERPKYPDRSKFGIEDADK